MLSGLSESPDGDDATTSRRDGDRQKSSRAGRARGKLGEIQQNASWLRDPLKWDEWKHQEGILAVRVDMIVDVPKASLRDQKWWEVPAGMGMPLEVTFPRWGILSLDIFYQGQGSG